MRAITAIPFGVLLLASPPAGDGAPLASPTAAPAAEAAAQPRRDTVQIVLTEYRLQMTPRVVPPGRTVFRIVNRGSETHSIELEWQDREEPGDDLEPGEESILTVNLDRGNWVVYCPLASPRGKGGHGRAGMRQILVVR